MIEIDRKDLNSAQRNARPLDPHERAAAGESDNDWQEMNWRESFKFWLCVFGCASVPIGIAVWRYCF